MNYFVENKFYSDCWDRTKTDINIVIFAYSPG